MFVSESPETSDGIAMDPAEPTSSTDAASFSDMLQYGSGLVVGEFAMEQRRAFAFREPLFASLAIKHASRVLRTVPRGHREVFLVELAVVGTVEIQAAKAR